MKWQDRVKCQLPRGHVGAHTNEDSGLRWFGQVLFDPLPGSDAEKDRNYIDVPEVKVIPPAWAEESPTLVASARGEDAFANDPPEPPEPVSKVDWHYMTPREKEHHLRAQDAYREAKRERLRKSQERRKKIERDSACFAYRFTSALWLVICFFLGRFFWDIGEASAVSKLLIYGAFWGIIQVGLWWMVYGEKFTDELMKEARAKELGEDTWR